MPPKRILIDPTAPAPGVFIILWVIALVERMVTSLLRCIEWLQQMKRRLHLAIAKVEEMDRDYWGDGDDDPDGGNGGDGGGGGDGGQSGIGQRIGGIKRPRASAGDVF